MKNAEDLPIIPFETPQDWETWLNEHHLETKGIWLKFAKKTTGIQSITYAEALEGALCYGWIDGQKASFDEQYWLQKFTPRRPKSLWSKINCEKATTLIGTGRMQAEGLRQVELAQADGRWERAYDGQKTSTMPADFQSALDSNPQALAFFSTLNNTNRYAMLFRIQTAQTNATRVARIQKFIDMLVRQEKIYP